MAWQVLLVRLPRDGASSLAALPAHYIPPSIGEPEQVLQRMVAVAKHTCETVSCLCAEGSRLVVMQSEDFVIEGELGGVVDVDRVVLYVLGSDAALPLVGSLARALGASAIDCETDKVLDADAIVPDTLRQWQIRIDELR